MYNKYIYSSKAGELQWHTPVGTAHATTRRIGRKGIACLSSADFPHRVVMVPAWERAGSLLLN